MIVVTLACVASISVGLGNKARQRNRMFTVLPTQKMGREPKKVGEGERESKDYTNLFV